MPKIPLEELVERLLYPAWQVNPCEVLCDALKFPESDCNGDCVKCLLKASGWDNMEVMNYGKKVRLDG